MAQLVSQPLGLRTRLAAPSRCLCRPSPVPPLFRPRSGCSNAAVKPLLRCATSSQSSVSTSEQKRPTSLSRLFRDIDVTGHRLALLLHNRRDQNQHYSASQSPATSHLRYEDAQQDEDDDSTASSARDSAGCAEEGGEGGGSQVPLLQPLMHELLELCAEAAVRCEKAAEAAAAAAAAATVAEATTDSERPELQPQPLSDDTSARISALRARAASLRRLRACVAAVAAHPDDAAAVLALQRQLRLCAFAAAPAPAPAPAHAAGSGSGDAAAIPYTSGGGIGSDDGASAGGAQGAQEEEEAPADSSAGQQEQHGGLAGNMGEIKKRPVKVPVQVNMSSSGSSSPYRVRSWSEFQDSGEAERSNGCMTNTSDSASSNSGGGSRDNADGNKEARGRSIFEDMAGLYVIGVASYLLPPMLGRVVRLWAYGSLTWRLVEDVAGWMKSTQPPPRA